MRGTLLARALFLASLTATACKEDPEQEPVVCEPGSRWEAGVPAFQEVTEDWGLSGVLGGMFTVADIDGDGWADLLVRNGGGPDDFSEGGERSRWVLRNTGNGSFEDFTEASGLYASRFDSEGNRSGQTAVAGDVDNDGDLDVYVGNSRTDPEDADTDTCELMLNKGDGSFELGPEASEARFEDLSANPAGLSFTDVNLDGFLDLWVVNNEEPGLVPMQDRLLLGDGSGSFAEVTEEAGLETYRWYSASYLNEAKSHSWGWGGAACDLNGDGLPELLASSYGRAPNHLWQAEWDGDEVVFVNQSIDSGYAFDHRTDWTDNLSAQCYCRDNPDAEDCDLCPLPEDDSICDSLAAAFGEGYRWVHSHGREPFSLGGNTGTTVCADIDNDGHIDLMTYEIVHSDVGSSSDPSEILVNLGEADARFDRPGEELTGLTRVDEEEWWDRGDMTGAVFDFDNDGWQDIYIGSAEYSGNKGLLFHQNEPLLFEPMDTDDYFLHYRAQGVAVADFDRDGDLDMVVGHSTHRCSWPVDPECDDDNQVRMYENLMGEGSNWIQLELHGGEGSNAMAIGARLELDAEGSIQTREVDGGHGRFAFQRDRVLHLGLGEACVADVTVYWPDAAGSEQSFELEANRRYQLRQGEEPVAQ